jgi:H+-translocating NAD(P) transhydrogenase subunit alpha
LVKKENPYNFTSIISSNILQENPSVIIGVPKEIYPGERRVALVPDTAAKLIKLGFEVLIEKGAGEGAYISDERFIESGAKIADSTAALYQSSDVILKVQRPYYDKDKGIDETAVFKKDSILITFMFSLSYPETAMKCAEAGINVLSMDAIPRITKAQRMDALSSQTNLAGYKSVIMAANEFGKIFPLMMTAAGTITPAKVVIMGAGVAGLQALGTAKRLGAIVEVSDVRPAVKEEVMSLGGKFIEVESSENLQDAGGYAKQASEEFLQKQKEVLFKHITEADVVITTALVPGRKAPVLVTEEMVKKMRPGSVVLDMAVEFGGNCELSEMNKVVEKYGVKIIGEPNIPSLLPQQASELYSKNILALLQHISKEGSVVLNTEDEIVKGSLITYKGGLVHERTREIINSRLTEKNNRK